MLIITALAVFLSWNFASAIIGNQEGILSSSINELGFSEQVQTTFMYTNFPILIERNITLNLEKQEGKYIMIEESLSDNLKLCSEHNIKTNIKNLGQQTAKTYLKRPADGNKFFIFIETDYNLPGNLNVVISYELCPDGDISRGAVLDGKLYYWDILAGQVKDKTFAKINFNEGIEAEIKQDYAIPDTMVEDGAAKMSISGGKKLINGYVWDVLIDYLPQGEDQKYTGTKMAMNFDFSYLNCSNKKLAKPKIILTNPIFKTLVKTIKCDDLKNGKLIKVINPLKPTFAKGSLFGLLPSKNYPVRCGITSKNLNSYCGMIITGKENLAMPYLAILKNNQEISLPIGSYIVVYDDGNRRMQKKEEVVKTSSKQVFSANLDY